MANLKTVPQEFIQSVFQPQIGVLSSNEAEKIVKKNNLTFAELISPFSKLKTEVSFRDHAGNITPIKNLQLSVSNLQQNPLPTNLARKLLNYVVSTAPDQPSYTIDLQPAPVQIPQSTPWFESWRDTFLKVQYPSDHEFTKHFMACMIVISSEEENILATLENLNKTIDELQNTTSPQRFPKFFSQNILRFYVVLHDKCQGSAVSAKDSFDHVRGVYGIDNSFLLQINSRNAETTEPPMTSNPWLPYVNIHQYPNELIDTTSTVDSDTIQSPDSIVSPTEQALKSVRTNTDLDTSSNVIFHPLSPMSEPQSPIQDDSHMDTLTKNSKNGNGYGAFITSQDLEQVHRFIQDFCIKALIPHVENEIQRLTDIVANRKGVSRSLFNATKRWFVSNKPGTAAATNVAVKVYNSDDAEVQLRKLADLYFMFGSYALAHEAYSAVKRDFYLDTTWQYYAGALEMASLSSFMMGEFSKKSFEYLEEAVNIYLTTCRMPQFATRTTLLSAECLRGMQWWNEQAKQLIRMTSEDSDLRSALLLEQASYCFLNCKPPMSRKYAFHIVLAGHRYSKAGQRKHTYRCYQQAAQVYGDRQWSLAEDHINYTLGRQAAYLNIMDKAADSFSKLLSTISQQNSIQQTTFFREMLTSFNNIQSQNPNYLPKLPVPILHDENTKVVLLPTAPLSAPGRIPATSFVLHSNLNELMQAQKFVKLEELIVHEALGNLPLIFRPSATVFTTNTNNSVKPFAVAGETIAVIIKLSNPLKVTITLRDVRLVWNFTTVDGISHCDDDSIVHTVPVQTVQLRIENSMELILYLTPMIAGELDIKGITFSLNPSTNDEQQTFSLPSVQAQLDINIHNKNQKRKNNATSQVVVEDYRLNLKIVPEAPCLQVTFSKVDTELLTGEIQFVQVEMMNSGNCTLTNLHFGTSVPHLLYYDLNTPEVPINENMLPKDIHRKQFVRKISTPESLDPGKKFNFNLYIKAPDIKGRCTVDWLVYYQSVKNQPKYRLVKQLWEFTVTESMIPSIQTEISEFSNKNGSALSISLCLTNPFHAAYVPSTLIQPLHAYMVANHWILGDKFYNDVNRIKLNPKETHEYFFNAFRSSDKSCINVTSLKLNTSVNEIPIQNALNYFVKNCINNIVKCDGDVEKNIIRLSKECENEGMMAVSWFAEISDLNGMRRTGYGFIKMPLEKNPKLVEEDEIFTEPLGVFRFSKSDLAIEEINRRQEMVDLEKKQKKIKYHATFPSNIIGHDFKISKICVIPITIHLTNLCDENLNAKIELLDQTYSHKWVGHTKPLQCVLKPYGMYSFQLQLAFTTYGLFDISNYFEVYCGPDINEAENTTQKEENDAIFNLKSSQKSKFTLQTYRRTEILSIINKIQASR
ncbi:trafficking protein particle complex subunit 8 isoform X2 [Chrysoperla carnea]|uniref:trafficking protein particle complex subunit 8 isoform X2 n=1 Tax=Chrysoperla carnea TaxID=189513 RepID=UPI001D07566D|nr:trafficking protein particle complex subunit 8 isoform X2 [Chrysoperla carnea]